MKKYEYDLVEIAFPGDLLNELSAAVFGNPLSVESRKKINDLVKNTVNELGKKGWKWHESGLATLPTIIVYREKGAKNVR
jgi:hypothetical protein